jgi:hypothetical protein
LPTPIVRAVVGVAVPPLAGVGGPAVAGIGVPALVGVGLWAVVGAAGRAVAGVDVRATVEAGVCFAALGRGRRAAFVRRRDVACAGARGDAAFTALRRGAAFAGAFLALGLAFVVRLRAGAGFPAGVMAGSFSEPSFHTRAARPAVKRMSAFRMSPVGMRPVGMRPMGMVGI